MAQRTNVDLLYRDAGNYKSCFVASVNRELKVGDEITLEEVSGRTQRDFWGSRYDDELDHNILEVIEVLPSNIYGPFDFFVFDDGSFYNTEDNDDGEPAAPYWNIP